MARRVIGEGAEAAGWGPRRGAAPSRCAPAPQVHLQTQQEVKLRMTGMALQVVRSDGILALYNGLSASLCRQVPGAPHQRPPGGAPVGPGPGAHALSSLGRQEGQLASPGPDVATPARCGHLVGTEVTFSWSRLLGRKEPRVPGSRSPGWMRGGAGCGEPPSAFQCGPAHTAGRDFHLQTGKLRPREGERRVQGLDLASPRFAKLLNRLRAVWPWEGSSVSLWSPRDGHVPGWLG